MAGRGTFQEYGTGKTVEVLEMEGTAAVSVILRDVALFQNDGGSPTTCRDTPNSAMLTSRPSRYWEYLLGLTLSLLVIHTFIRPTAASLYTNVIGYVGLAIEAVLPLPQIISNQRAHSCKGFRLSVLVNWLLGDAMKMAFFFHSEPGKVPWAFKLCGIFQACCDVGLGAQYWVYGDGQEDVARMGGLEKDGRLT